MQNYVLATSKANGGLKRAS